MIDFDDKAQKLVESVLPKQYPMGYRFGVYFFALGVIPNPLDTRFQKVSGIDQQIKTYDFDEGGQNLYTHRLPRKVNYQNLVLERGFTVGSLLNIEFNAVMSFFKFYTSNVIVTLYNENDIPIAGWLFMNTYPVRWKVSDFNANESKLVIDTMELSYKRIQALRI